jgi:hypothetical protein
MTRTLPARVLLHMPLLLCLKGLLGLELGRQFALPGLQAVQFGLQGHQGLTLILQAPLALSQYEEAASPSCSQGHQHGPPRRQA